MLVGMTSIFASGARARVTMRKNFKKPKIAKSMLFQRKNNVFAPRRLDWSLRSHPRGFSY